MIKEKDNKSLAHKNPDLACQWHPTKNGVLTPLDVTPGSKRKVWWLGKCGHEWESTVDNRNRGRGCGTCSGKGIKSLLRGFNDMWTTNPKLASLLLNPEDGFNFSQSSGKKVNWKCPSCNNPIYERVIASINKQGLHCPLCDDGVPFGERFIYNLLKLNNIKFQYDTMLEWSEKYRYDFYLEDYDWIIEVHGRQHYEEGFNFKNNKRNLEFEIQNDLNKKSLAKSININNYVVLDARISKPEYIYNSLIKSDLVNLTPNINVNEILEKMDVSFIKIVGELWDSGMHNTMSVASQIGFGRSTTIKYLKRAAEIGWCTYNPNDEISKNGYLKGKQNNKEIVQLSLDGEFIKVWHSTALAAKELKISKGNISSVCNRLRPTAGGFKWMFKEKYYKL